MRTTKVAAVVSLALLASLLAVGVAWAAPGEAKDPTLGATAELRKAVEPAGILVHERRFQRIADRSLNAAGVGTRASGTGGYDASAGYVADKLEAAGYDVSVQPFDFPFFQQTGPATFVRTDTDPDTEYEEGTDFAVFDYSGDGTGEGAVEAVDVNFEDPSVITSGCEDSDFAQFTAGNVALIQRGTCTFGEKVTNAQEAGAVAVIIFNQGDGGEDRTELFEGTLGAPAQIPAISVSFALGRELAQAGAAVKITTPTENETRQTTNVIADTPTGDEERTVVVGAHLDSVVEGPGINDNGSGSATILEIALRMRELGIEPTNRVRFAFWGAEESGLLGSQHYVDNLSEEELDDIALNLNFDMLASPNFVRFVYDGDGSATGTKGPAGSEKIERVFTRYFDAKGLRTKPTAFDGRSDYGPFIAVGIPAGGLFSGAEGIKTKREASVYGGKAGEPYDPCYHEPCDDITNLSSKSLNQMSDAVAHATLTYANDDEIFVGPSAVGARSFGEVYGQYKGPDLIR